MILAEAVAASPKKREVAFMVFEGTARGQFWVEMDGSLEEIEENSVRIRCIHFLYDIQRTGHRLGFFLAWQGRMKQFYSH